MRYQVPGRCPVCGRDLYVKKLACAHCGTAVEGAFELPRLARLSPEHQHFIELFIRAEGKLNRVQEILGVSYPTVRAQLHEVIRALGYEPATAEETQPRTPSTERRRQILADLEAGKITSEQAIKLLKGESS
ncbi:MAG TPA: DUF2089 domain-containing protein [Anaerolineae bacterium]|nr:DUF2089 domain-containing protein [Anaerolineae bacterium]